MKLKRWWRGGRWKGELYVLPTIRLAWGRDLENDPRSYWIGIFWLQWSLHFGFVEEK